MQVQSRHLTIIILPTKRYFSKKKEISGKHFFYFIFFQKISNRANRHCYEFPSPYDGHKIFNPGYEFTYW